jgi:hypothetical protein
MSMSTIDFPLRPPSKLSVRIEDYRPWRSNTLFGFTTVVIPEVRLRIIDLTAHASHGRRWIGLPGRPQITAGGVVRKDERGKPLYSPVLQFVGRDVADAFSDRVVEALLVEYPRAFDAEESAP